MESKKINQLATNLAPVNTDLTVIGDPVTGELKKITLLQIASLFGAGLTSVGMVVPSGFSVSPSTLTSSGTFTITGAGTTSQYIDGTGALQTFPTLLNSDKLIHIVRNNSGATISKGTIVYINGALGNKPTIAKALATSDATSAQTYGVVQADILNNADGNIVVIGDVENLDTSAVTEGTQLYLSGTTAGAYTTTKPYAPIHLVYVAIVLRSHPTLGIIGVKIQNGYEMDELHNVSAQSPANNDGLFWNSTTSLWEKNTIAGVLGYTPVTSARTISTTSPLSGGGDLSANRTLSIAQATTSANGYLSSTDWNLFNNKQSTITLTVTGSSGASTFSAGTLNIPTYTLSGLGGQPLSTNLTNLSGLTFVSTSFVKMTASGTFGLDTNTYYLASNPSGYTSNVGTVTSVAALTLGTTGTDLSSSVATGTSTPVITLNVPTASGTNRGVLSSSDWTLFNSKQGAITLTTTGSSGSATLVTNTLNIPTYTLTGLGGQASSTNLTSLSGLTYVSASFVKMTASGTFSLDTSTYLTANQTITLSGDISGSGTTAITTAIGTNKVTNAMLAQIATASFLGRVTAATGNVETLTATQATSILNTFTSTLKGLVPLSGGGTTNFLRADGTWASPTGTGFTNPMTTLGDIIYGDTGGSAARLAGNTTAVKQYLSQTGTGTISAAPTWVAIAGSDITGAALTSTNDTNVTITLGGTPSTSLLRAASITLGWTGTLADARIASAATWNAKESALTFSTPLSRTTNTISIPAATTSVNGYLTSTDWNTFNGKQGAITLTTTGTSGAATLVGTTLNIPQYSGTNIYNSDGTLAGTRAVTMGANSLTFTATRTSGTAYSIINTQSTSNAADTQDSSFEIKHTFSATTGTELVTRAMSFISYNTGVGSTLTNMRVWNVASNTSTGSVTTNLDQLYIEKGLTTAGTVTNNRAIFIPSMQGTNQAAIVINTIAGGGNNSALIIGATAGSIPTGDFGIYQYTTENNFFGGSVEALSFKKTGFAAGQILMSDGSVITAGTNITISAGTISASGGGGTDFYTTNGTLTSARTITGGGFDLTYSNNQNAATTFFVSNTTAGTLSQSGIRLTSDASSGYLSIGKLSSTYTPLVATIGASDSAVVNNTAGNLVLANLVTGGLIKFAIGTGSTPLMTLTSDSHLLINTTTNGTYFLDVNGDVNVTGKINIAQGTATRAPIDFTPGSAILKTSPLAGDMEVDAGGKLYYTHNTSERAVVCSVQYVQSQTSTPYGAAFTTARPIFSGLTGATNGAITLKANTRYHFEMLIYLTGLSSTSGTFGLSFTGTVTVSNMLWQTQASKSSSPTTAGADANTLNYSTATPLNTANTAITTAATGTTGYARVIGWIRTGGTAGTFVPNINLQTSATPTLQQGSYFKIFAVSDNTTETLGNWS